MQEFEKLNENFRKFINKRKNPQNSGKINSSKSRQINNLITVKSSDNNKFDDATSEITVNAKANVDRSLNINLSKMYPKNSQEKLEISNISPENIVLEEGKIDSPKLEQNDKEDTNIISTENEFTESNSISINSILPKKLGKYRRNRNMRQLKATLD